MFDLKIHYMQICPACKVNSKHYCVINSTLTIFKQNVNLILFDSPLVDVYIMFYLKFSRFNGFCIKPLGYF